MEKGVNKILNVSWRFGVTAASSESDNVDKSFMQLHIIFSEDNKTKSIFTEMSIAEFYKFLHDLEKAKSSLDLLV